MPKMVVGFSRPKKFKIGSYFIRAWQGFVPYSHVYLKFENKWLGVDVVYQASHGAVNCVEYNNFISSNIVIDEFMIDMSDDSIRQAVRSCIFLLQKPYGYLGLFKLICKKLFKIEAKGDGIKSLHCSELACIICPDLAINKDPDFVEPIDLYNNLKKVL